MHTRGILHRDIQLGNCVMGLEPNQETLYMIDFGFSKFYIDPHTRRHIPDSRAPRDFIGNYWFSSVRVHCHGRGTYACSLVLLTSMSDSYDPLFSIFALDLLQCPLEETTWKRLPSCSSTC